MSKFFRLHALAAVVSFLLICAVSATVHSVNVGSFFVVVAQNMKVSPVSPPGTDQNNAAVSISEVAPGELYSVFNDFLFPGAPGPTVVNYSFSLAGGAPGTWMQAVKPPDPPYTEEWNPWISAVVPPMGGHVMVGSQRFGPPFAPVPNAIVANVTPGGGAAFGAGLPIMVNAPPVNWLDFPVVEVDDGASPAFGDATIVWTEYIDATGGDADGNANPFDDVGDTWAIWTATTAIGGGTAPPYPLFTPPVAIMLPGLPTFPPNSLGSQRAALDVVAAPGTPLVPPGGVYVAFADWAAGVIFVDANPAPGIGAPWGVLTGGGGPLPAVPTGGAPVLPVIAPGIRATSSVTIAVDNMGACPGAVYLAWSVMGATDIEIMFSSSFDGGLTWTPPIRVNQDPVGNGRDQWAPHMRLDPTTREIIITYYDRRNDPANTLVEVWSSTSPDCGITWLDCMITRTGPTPPVSVTPLVPGMIFADYLGSDWNPAFGMAHVWNDGRTGGDEDIFFDSMRLCDTDADGIPDSLDNCPFVFNPAQIDSDGDTYGVPCDCDDTNPGVNPGAFDIPNDGIDQDCNGADAVMCYNDADGDTYGDTFDPGTYEVSGSCPPGKVGNNTDCDDTDGTVFPGAPEIPNDGIDQDCNGVDATMCYTDADGDTYGDLADPGTLELSGICPAGKVADNTDCDDTDAGINPGATEIPGDGIDQDCDGIDPSGCCVGIRGNFDGIGGEPGIDIADLLYMVDYQFGSPSGPPPPCFEEGDYDASLGIDIADLLAMVDYQFGSPAGPPPGSC